MSTGPVELQGVTINAGILETLQGFSTQRNVLKGITIAVGTGASIMQLKVVDRNHEPIEGATCRVLNAIVSPSYADLLDAWPADEETGTTLLGIKGNDGTLYGVSRPDETPTPFGSSKVIYGDGTDDRVDLGNLQAGQTLNFTYECWFKTTQTGNDRWIISEGSTVSNTPVVGLINQGGVLRALVRLSGTGVNVFGAKTINDGNWHHLAMTHDGTTLKIYVDGEPDGSSTASPGTGTTNTTHLFALRRSSISLYAQGYLSEARIWNIARTEEEINETINQRATNAPVIVTGYDPTPYSTGTTSANGLTTLNFQIDTIYGLEVTLPGKRRFIMPFKRTTRGLLDWQVMLSDYLATFATDRGNILINSEPENNDANFLIE